MISDSSAGWPDGARKRAQCHRAVVSDTPTTDCFAPTFFLGEKHRSLQRGTTMYSNISRSSVAVQTKTISKSPASKQVDEGSSSLAAWLDQGANVNAKNSE
jgi:hypothetical protein